MVLWLSQVLCLSAVDDEIVMGSAGVTVGVPAVSVHGGAPARPADVVWARGGANGHRRPFAPQRATA